MNWTYYVPYDTFTALEGGLYYKVKSSGHRFSRYVTVSSSPHYSSQLHACSIYAILSEAKIVHDFLIGEVQVDILVYVAKRYAERWEPI